MKTYEPLGNRILMKLDPEGSTSSGGIYIPEDERKGKAKQSATVVAIGKHAFKNLFDDSPWVSVGDRVLIVRYAGIELRPDELPEDMRIDDKAVYRVIEEVDLILKVHTDDSLVGSHSKHLYDFKLN